MQSQNFWTTDCPRPADLQVSALPTRADVAIVGSGYTGLHAAIALRKAGASVAVLEQHTIGWGASSRNGGMATSGLKMEMPAVFKKYGAEVGRLFWEWAQGAIDHVETTVHEEGIECDFRRSGHALLAVKPAHMERMREETEWFHRTLGHNAVRMVERTDLAGEIGSTLYYGAQVDETSAALHPARYVFGLAQAAIRHGAQLVEDAPVLKIEKQERGWLLSTRQGVLLANEVLLATNGYTTNLVPQARQGVFPAGSYILVTEPLSVELQQEISPKNRMFFDTKHFLNYFRLTPDGRLLIGGRHNLSTTLDTDESAILLRRRMVELFPQLVAVPSAFAWTGKLGLTFDLMPHVGRTEGKEGGIWYAYGYAGHGVAIASRMGCEVGEMIAGKRTGNPFSQISQLRFPFTRYDRYYLPLVSAWFRFLDAVQ